MTIDDRQKVCRLPSLLCQKSSPFFTMSKSGINLPHPQLANLKQTLITALISNMHSKTGAPRFLRKKWRLLSKSLFRRPPADQKARRLWVRDWSFTTA